MQSVVYHIGTLHYRRLPVLISGLVLAGFCGYYLAHLIPAWFAVWHDAKKVLLGLFVIGITTLFLIIGIMLVRYYLTNYRRELRIDSLGVSYGRRFYPWSEVGALSARWHNGSLSLRLHRRGLLALDRPLLTDAALTWERYDRLIERLKDEIGATYPHLRLGGL